MILNSCLTGKHIVLKVYNQEVKEGKIQYLKNFSSTFHKTLTTETTRLNLDVIN